MANKENKTRVIKIPFPDQKFKQYLESVGTHSIKKLDSNQVETIFLKTIRDFKTGKLSLDDFSVISEHLWFKMILKNKNASKTKLGELLHKAGELNFYIRRADYKEVGQIFVQFLGEVLKFEKER